MFWKLVISEVGPMSLGGEGCDGTLECRKTMPKCSLVFIFTSSSNQFSCVHTTISTVVNIFNLQVDIQCGSAYKAFENGGVFDLKR